MSNGEAVETFVQGFLHAPSIAEQVLREALSVHGYELTITKKPAPIESEPHLYQFPFMTAEKGVATV